MQTWKGSSFYSSANLLNYPNGRGGLCLGPGTSESVEPVESQELLEKKLSESCALTSFESLLHAL